MKGMGGSTSLSHLAIREAVHHGISTPPKPAVICGGSADAAPGGRHRDTANFLSQATKDVFGGADANLADRVSRRKYYNDRNRDEDAGAFRR